MSSSFFYLELVSGNNIKYTNNGKSLTINYIKKVQQCEYKANFQSQVVINNKIEPFIKNEKSF